MGHFIYLLCLFSVSLTLLYIFRYVRQGNRLTRRLVQSAGHKFLLFYLMHSNDGSGECFSNKGIPGAVAARLDMQANLLVKIPARLHPWDMSTPIGVQPSNTDHLDTQRSIAGS